jgi:hypothetical protein
MSNDTKHKIRPLAAAIGTGIVISLSCLSLAQATGNPFSSKTLQANYNLASENMENGKVMMDPTNGSANMKTNDGSDGTEWKPIDDSDNTAMDASNDSDNTAMDAKDHSDNTDMNASDDSDSTDMNSNDDSDDTDMNANDSSDDAGYYED